MALFYLPDTSIRRFLQYLEAGILATSGGSVESACYDIGSLNTCHTNPRLVQCANSHSIACVCVWSTDEFQTCKMLAKANIGLSPVFSLPKRSGILQLSSNAQHTHTHTRTTVVDGVLLRRKKYWRRSGRSARGKNIPARDKRCDDPAVATYS